MSIKCLHCQRGYGTLIRLNPSKDIEKIVCLQCLCARHPKSAMEIFEYILDREQEDSEQGNSSKLIK